MCIQASIFAEPELGGKPPVVMLREYRDRGGTCKSCSDYFVIQLTQTDS
jgi:hypothetical protein